MAKCTNGRSRKPKNPFILNTYKMLQQSNKAIVDWSADGMSLVIKDNNRLSEELSKFSSSDKASSFIRQLNSYGFRKLHKDEVPPNTPHDFKYYHHSSFQRDKPQLLKDIYLKRKESELETVQELREEIDTLKDQVNKLQKQQDCLMNWIVQERSYSAQGSSAEPGAAAAADAPHPLTVPAIPAPVAPQAAPKRTSALLRRKKNSSSSSSVAGHKRRRNSNDEAVAEARKLIGPNEEVASLSRNRSITRSMSRQRSGSSQDDAAEASALSWVSRVDSADILGPDVQRITSAEFWDHLNFNELVSRSDSQEKDNPLDINYVPGIINAQKKDVKITETRGVNV